MFFGCFKATSGLSATTGEATFFFASQNHPWKGKTMHSFIKRLLLTSLLMTPGLFAGAQTGESAGTPTDITGNATKQEVEQLRQEVLEQRQTIEQLKTLVQQLVDAKSQPAAQPAADGVDHAVARARADAQVV